MMIRFRIDRLFARNDKYITSYDTHKAIVYIVEPKTRKIVLKINVANFGLTPGYMSEKPGTLGTFLDNEFYVIRTSIYDEKSLYFINLLNRSLCFLPTNA